jgi:hypothetical protein
LSVSQSSCLAQSDSTCAPPVPQRPPKKVTFVGLPPSPSSKVKMTGEGIRKPSRSAPPPPLLIPPRLRPANREVLQGDSPESAVPVNPPASRSSWVTGERIRKPSLPKRPPPLVLHPARIVRKAPKIASAAKSKTVTFADEVNRDSLGSSLTNPWDSGVTPQHATFESPIFQRPSLPASVGRANALKAGLPRNPRETRIIPPNVRYR